MRCTYAKSIVVGAMVMVSVVHACAIERYRITQAMLLDWLHLDGSAVHLSVPEMSSRVPRPPLALLSKHRQQDHVRLRVACDDPTNCLPFYVELEFDSEVVAANFADRITRTTKVPTIAKLPLLVTRGSIARLEVVIGGVRLQLYVRCLQSGAQGDVIRVSDDKMHRIYRARVLDKDHLRADL